MYTALHFNALLKLDVDPKVVQTLKYMTGQRDTLVNLPEDDFFSTDKWEILFLMDSYYFPAVTHSVVEDLPGRITGYALSVTSNLKNYDSEIETFLEWIMPHVDAEPGQWLGYWMYEEDEQPTMIYYPEY